jgi:hypothetical protein
VTSAAAARVILISAVVLVAGTGALASGFSPFAIPFIAWGLAPYGVLYVVARAVANPWAVGGAGVAALTVEAGVRASVLLFPQGSTAAIALVFSPLIVGAIAMPVGAACGVVMGFVFARGGALARLAAVAVAVAAIALTFIGLARPELFPTTVAARRRAVAAIGEPRVVTGTDRFVRTSVSQTPAWHIAGEFDDTPGEDLAVVDHQGAQIVDALSLQPGLLLPFGGEPGRLWGPFSRLVRLGDGFAVVQSGGGFSETEVKTLDNQLLWRFHPAGQPPPTALLPGDLDEDGETEFYASSSDAVTRVDTRGQPVWSTRATLPSLVALVPRGEGGPAWVVSTRYGVTVDVWSPDGTRLGELKWPGARVHGVVDWLGARSVVSGDSSARGDTLDGRTPFQIAIEDPMRLLHVATWQPGPDSGALLVTITGSDQFLARWRMRVYASPEAIVYDEVLNQLPRVFTARRADGASTLFVKMGDALSILRSR